MLKIVEKLNRDGLEKTVSDLELKHKLYYDKVILKYDQLSSPVIMALEEVQECRGLILELDTWKVIGMAFKKFFNHSETNAHTINWNTARILEKCDGSLINLHYDWNKDKWFAATTGTAEGEGNVNGMLDLTFNQLFWNTASKYGLTENKLTKGFSYVFELMTPYNIVVKPHSESSLTLLTIRDLKTLNELSYNDVMEVSKQINIPVVTEYDLNKNIDSLVKTFENMPFSEEGYVIVDNDFNRVKLKNPEYVLVHHLKDKLSFYNILGIIKNNEVEEFISTFKERENEILELREKYYGLIRALNHYWCVLYEFKPKNNTKEERKNYATNVFKVCSENNLMLFSNMFFSLIDGKTPSPEEYLKDFDNKRLYEHLKKC